MLSMYPCAIADRPVTISYASTWHTGNPLLRRAPVALPEPSASESTHIPCLRNSSSCFVGKAENTPSPTRGGSGGGTGRGAVLGDAAEGDAAAAVPEDEAAETGSAAKEDEEEEEEGN